MLRRCSRWIGRGKGKAQMQTQLDEHILQRINATAISDDPFAHLFVEDVFPGDFYTQIVQNLPDFDAFVVFAETGRVGEDYNPNRLFLSSAEQDLERLPPHLRPFWQNLFSTIDSLTLLQGLINKFHTHIGARFQDPKMLITNGELDIGLRVSMVRDRTGFELGPHTDGLKKILSGLFYLPADDSHLELGTSLYTPTDPTFKCPGGPHYGFEGFSRAKTMPFKPNTFFMFVKTDDSFHGVEEVIGEASRDILFLDIVGYPVG